jgi:transcriptional regulator of acetoin/glycerol metabolism
MLVPNKGEPMSLAHFDSAELPTRPVIQDILGAAPSALGDLVYALIGRAPLDRVRDAIRHAMLTEALARTSGNVSHTARLLGVKRQAVQQMLVRYELRSWAQGLRERARCGE